MTCPTQKEIAAGSGHRGTDNTVSDPTKKPQFRATKRSLPWLDGKSSLATSPASTDSPPARKVNLASRTKHSPSPKRTPSVRSTTSLSPLSRHSKAAPATLSSPARQIGSSPLSHKRSDAGPSECRASSAEAGTVTRKKGSEFHGKSTARSALPSSREIVVRRPSIVSHEPRKRLSIVRIEDPEDPLEDFRPRADSLAPVPDHLARAESPDSVVRPPRQNAYSVSPPHTPHFVKMVQMSPTQPVPKPTAFERASRRRLSNAIEELEDLVQDAVMTAEDAQDPNQVGEIYEIVENARTAIQEAENSVPHLMRTSSPLKASSSSELSIESFEDSSPDEPSNPAPTRSPPKIPAQKNIVEDLKQLHHDEHKGWARHFGKDGTPVSSSPSFSDIDQCVDQGHGHSSTDLLLLQPEPTQTAPRDHIDFVLRPAIPREHSRGRSPKRKSSDPNAGPRRRRHHRSWRSHEDRSRSSRRRRRHKSSSLSYFDTSFDEEDLHTAGRLHGIKRYGNELHVRDQAHHHTFSLRRHHRRQPIARNWRTGKKRITAAIACINTALLGIIVGIYAGEVPRIQYILADERHHAIIGNVVFYAGLAISTFIAWPLPLLHGRKPYILAALALAMPLQFPQALVLSAKRSPNNPAFRTGLLVSRLFSGLVLGFANVNFFSTLLDLFGASLQSKHPHQEFIVVSDVRRHGGGMGIWLGIWSWCSIGSLAVGFQIGAGIIESLTPDWGFYITIMILAGALLLNVMAPETRRSAYRRSVTEVYDRDENFITRRVARGEIKLHISTEGPKYWFEEVYAGLKLSTMMMCQPGFLVLALYLGWIYAQIVLVIVLLGSLLSRDYKWHPRYVGLGVISIAIGALFAIPLTKAGIFSRERKKGFRTDSMTFEKQVTWSSHLVRRVVFTLTLPLMGLAYTVSSAGRPKPYMVPIAFAAAVGFLSILAIAECHGLIMETFDTCDLQPGVNTRHRLQSMAVQDRRRRTNYSSFPRVSAGIFASQTLSFIGAAVATEVGGIMTRHIGAQASTGVTAGILFFLTILLTLVLWRFKSVQVIPNHTVFGTRRDTAAWTEFKDLEKEGRGSDWKAVVIGNPSGKMRRMSVLELGSLSRWTEIRKLNFLIRGEERKRKRDDWHQGGGW